MWGVPARKLNGDPPMRPDPTTAWKIDERDYPTHGSVTDQLHFLLRYAILAPSGHNSQPWRFRVAGDTVELLLDRRRSLPVVDPHDRALVISCGAALLQLRLALHHFGHEELTEAFPESAEPDLAARTTRGAARTPSAAEERLFHALPERHSDRHRFHSDPVPDDLPEKLAQAAREEGARLWLPRTAELRRAVADLIAEGDRIQAANPEFRRELAAWMHPNQATTPDGMPGYAHGMSDLVSRVAPLAIRTFDWGPGQAAKDRQLAEEAPLLIVLLTAGDTPEDWLKAGQALGRVLLTARAEGVSSSFLNQPIEVPSLRERLTGLTGSAGAPQLLLRMGYGEPVRPTPRRPLEDVLQ